MIVSAIGEPPRQYSTTFRGGIRGSWRVDRVEGVRGATLPLVSRIEILRNLEWELPAGCVWSLRGVTEDYHSTRTAEQERLRAVQPGLGRPASTRAALIPIRKSQSWWDLPLSERRAIFEARSQHIATGLEHLPTVARRLHHGRRPGGTLPFPHLVRVRPPGSVHVRSTRGALATNGGVTLC